MIVVCTWAIRSTVVFIIVIIIIVIIHWAPIYSNKRLK